MNDLELYREELANCDAKITEALKERYAIIEKIMAYKEEYGMPILQPEQEEKQKKRLMFSLHNDKHRDEIYDVFERIQRNSKKIQARKLFDYNIVLIGLWELEKVRSLIILAPCLPWKWLRWTS